MKINMNEVKQSYLVVGWGKSKKTGEVYSRCAAIKGDRNAEKFQYADLNDLIFLNEIRPLGSIVHTSIRIESSEVSD